MRLRLAILSWVILLSLAFSAQAQSTGSSFTLQVASFPDVTLAKQYATKLALAGEQAGLCTVELPGRGRWTRVLVGEFQTVEAARHYGESLRRGSLIESYLIIVDRDPTPLNLGKPIATRAADAPSSVPILKRSVRRFDGAEKVSGAMPTADRLIPALKPEFIISQRAILMSDLRASVSSSLPRARQIEPALAPTGDPAIVPHPDPVQKAFGLITGVREGRGGLWVTGDQVEGLARLRWIAGSDHADLISLDEYGHAQLDTRRLAEAAAVNRAAPLAAPLAIVDYIVANEGLWLLVQLTEGRYRYCLHIGHWAATAGGLIEVNGSINLDNNYDSRINPYRRTRQKLDSERPPAEFDSLVAMNPQAQWFNLRTHSLVPVAHIAFHELAEAQAKLAFNLDYLVRGEQPGAHDIALEREMRLKAQRPLAAVVITLGLNRVLKSADELRQVVFRTADTQR
jgi:hypothetical protein